MADLSHQLKTPLANVKLYTELLKDQGVTNEERENFVRCLNMETDKLQWLLNSLTKITRLEIGAIQFDVEEQSLYDTLELALFSVKGVADAKEDYNNIFKRFYRGKNVENMPGSGLGLYLAQLIMNKQGGYIVVAPAIDKGSIFQVYMKR